jgi:hypothetical protein
VWSGSWHLTLNFMSQGRVAAITAKQSDTKTAHQRYRDFFDTAENLCDSRPPFGGVRSRRWTLDHGPYGAVNLWEPVCEFVPILFQKREPGKRASTESPFEKLAYCGIQN